MNYEPKEVIVLGAIRNGAKNFDKIRKATQIDPDELNSILQKLEESGMLRLVEKKGWLGKKIELTVTEKGEREVENRIHEMEQKWNEMTLLYKKGDKQGLQQYMDNSRSFLPMMMFFGIMDMMMFSMMFSMMGMAMSDYVPPEQMPENMDSGAEGDSGDMGGDGGFDIDIGF